KVPKLLAMTVVPLALIAAAVHGQSALDGFDPNANGSELLTASVQNGHARMTASSPDARVRRLGDKSALPTKSQHFDADGPRLLAKLSPNPQHRQLSLADRIVSQRAIEEVYWRHRIWPKERPDPKPSLDAVMSNAQVEKKVADYLRKSQALEDYWQRPITAEQLQAEMDRMTRHTKQPEVLRELFETLGNDPFVIAECLARPALAERLVTNWYAYDQRIHGELKRRAETELQTRASVEQMKQLSGKDSEMEVVKNDPAQAKQNRDSGRSIKLNGHEWDETAQKLSAMFRRIE